MDPEPPLCGEPCLTLSNVLQETEAIDSSVCQPYCSWQDVLDAMEGAIEAAKGLDKLKADNSLLGIRTRLRKSGPEITTLDSLTDMIPDQSGLSLLRGGLTTLFKLVSLRLETREMIFRAFQNIPQELVSAVEAGARYPDALDLRHAVKQLCDTLIRTLPTLIRILLRSHSEKNKLTRFMKQHPGREAGSVQSCLDEISRASKRVKQCSRAATECAIGEIVQQQRTLIVSTDCLGGDLSTRIDEMNARISNVEMKNDSRHKQSCQYAERIFEVIQSQGQQHLSYYSFQQRSSLPWLTATSMPAAPRLLVAAAPAPADQMLFETLPSLPHISLQDLLDVLNVPDGAAAEALDRVTQRGREPRLNAGAKGRHLLGVKRFQGWLAAPSWASDLVLLDGHCGNLAVEKVSPMSAICAALVEVLEKPAASLEYTDEQSQIRPAAIVLHHFCSQYLSQGPLTGPAGLICHLIQQLLVQGYQHNHDDEPQSMPPALDFIDDELVRHLDDHEVSGLCQLFYHLVVQLDPSRPVFCIVDCISEMETALHGWQSDVCLVVETLLDLVNDADRAGPALRVLLTSSERSTRLADTVVPSNMRVSLLAARAPGRHPSLSTFQTNVDNMLMRIGGDAEQGAGR